MGAQREALIFPSRIVSFAAVLAVCLVFFAYGSEGQSRGAKPSTATSAKNGVSGGYGAIGKVPQLVDITSSTGIYFEHRASSEQKYIVESMSGGVALIDYDGDGWLDIYFTNAPNVAMALEGKKAKSALFHNNHDGTFTDVTDKAGVGYPCWAMGAAVG
ncbi:MAG TPA: VCBS repeat-containing protein, partial [Edaphobacter sp.]